MNDPHEGKYKFNPSKAWAKIQHDIFFNKKRRAELKKSFLTGQKILLESVNTSIKPVLKEEYFERELETSILTIGIRGLELIRNAEDFDRKSYLTNCKYGLYKKGKQIVFKATFLKPLLSKKLKTSYLYFPQGVPENSKKKAYIYRNGKKFDLKGYKRGDFGIFRQKMLDFGLLTLNYKGKKRDYKFKLKLINEKKQSYWVRII